jgi:hypothetical protein
MMDRRHEEMNQIASRMFKGFGMSDPFENDPFFSGKSMFGGMDKMMS